MIQMPNVIAKSSAPWRLSSPAVEESIGATKSWMRSLRRTSTIATATAAITAAVASAIHSTEPGADLAEHRVADDEEEHEDHARRRAARSATIVPSTVRREAAARGAISTTRTASPARAGRTLLTA